MTKPCTTFNETLEFFNDIWIPASQDDFFPQDSLKVILIISLKNSIR
jgi:hypothetical protein